MRTISSRANEEIQNIHALKQEKGRAQHQCFVAEGVRACATLLAHNTELVALYATDTLIPDAQTLLRDYCQNKNGAYPDDDLVHVSQPVMEKISSASTPSGIIGVFRIPPKPTPDALTTGLVLANISNPGNMGTLIRSASAVGVQSVVIIEGTDPWSPKVIQATAGTIGAVTIFTWTWQELMHYKKGKQLYALVVSNGKPLNIISPDNALLVIGNEAHGLSAHHINDCEHSVTIQMPGSAESLNAAVAGSIALYITFVR